jgi:DNA-binding Lrp family transcriptional regulator
MQIVAVTDPLQIGLHRQAMVGVRTEGDVMSVADALADVDEVDYVVVTAGSFDLLVEVVCSDDEQLLDIVGRRIRAMPGGAQHRDLRLPEVAQADLFVECQTDARVRVSLADTVPAVVAT